MYHKCTWAALQEWDLLKTNLNLATLIVNSISMDLVSRKQQLSPALLGIQCKSVREKNECKIDIAIADNLVSNGVPFPNNLLMYIMCCTTEVTCCVLLC